MQAVLLTRSSIHVRLTCILVSRFLLDLQGATRQSLQLGQEAGLHTETADARTKSTIVFERVVGSIASILEPTTDDDWDETALGCDHSGRVNVESDEAEGSAETKF